MDSKLSLIAAVLTLVASSLLAQESIPRGTTKTFQIRGDDAVVIGELGLVVIQEDAKVVVKAVLPKGQGGQESAADVATGDEIAMVNGKRLRSVKELKVLYESTPSGSECKLGIRREGQPHIVTFLKKDAKDLPQRMVIRRQADDEHGGFFPALGIGIAEQGSDVTISEVLPNAPGNISKGDVVKSLNTKPIKKASDFSREFDSTEIGGMLVIGLERDGKPLTVTTKRPEPKEQIITR